MSDAATQYTYEFVRRALPDGAERLLEVGCGRGELAARLHRDGYQIVAVDSDEEAVAAAEAAGVDARFADWPHFADGSFDAVLFTRSLHHVHDLAGGIGAALACLRPGGRIIVEDFDFDFADERTFGWFAGLVRVIAAAGVPLGGSDFLSGLAAGEKAPLQVWQDAHHHDLHSAHAIETALRAAAASLRVEGAAYFFRYLDQAAPVAEPLVEALRAHELDLIRLGRIAPLGRRFVAEA